MPQQVVTRSLPDRQQLFGNAVVQRQLADRRIHRHPDLSRLQREPDGSARAAPSYTDPGSGVTVEPGEIGPDKFGAGIPLPSRLMLLKPPGSGQGSALTAPSFALKIDPRIMVAGILDRVDLGGFTLVNPTVVFNPKSNTLTGTATLSIPSSQYPAHLIAPTDVHVRFQSSSLGSVKIEGETGPFVGELTLSIDYDDVEGLKKLKRAMLSGDLEGGLATLSDLPKNAKFSARGRLGLGTQKYSLPLAVGGAKGEVNQQGVDWAAGTAGALLVPKGTFRQDMDVPGVGAQGQLGQQSRAGERSVTSGMAGITGTPSIAAATQGKFGEVFPPFLYAQISHTTTSAKGHVLGIRLSGHLRLAGAAAAPDPREQAAEKLQQNRYRQGGDASNPPAIDPTVTGAWDDMRAESRDERWRGSVEVFGTFDLLGG